MITNESFSWCRKLQNVRDLTPNMHVCYFAECWGTLGEEVKLMVTTRT
jgi:hypothetical protein